MSGAFQYDAFQEDAFWTVRPVQGGGGGLGAPIHSDASTRRFRKKPERKPRLITIKIGDWPDEVIALPAVAHGNDADLNDVLSGLNIEDADTDDEEAMAVIMGLSA